MILKVWIIQIKTYMGLVKGSKKGMVMILANGRSLQSR